MNTARHPDEAYGLSDREEKIVAELERGLSPGTIARLFGISTGSVMVMKGRYIITDDQLTAFERKCRIGEAKYRAALCATGKVFA